MNNHATAEVSLLQCMSPLVAHRDVSLRRIRTAASPA